MEAGPDGGYFRRVAEWTGYTGGWVQMQDALTGLDGASAVHLRFRLLSDGSIQRSGAYLDNVAVRCLRPTYSGAEYESRDGTSMASPHVAGAAALLFAATPGADAGTVRSALLGGVETKPTLLGVTATGGRLNVSNSLDRLVTMVRFRDAGPTVGESSGVATIEVQRTGDVGQPASVSYQTSGGTATPGTDYAPANGELSFTAGQTTASLTIPITDDDVFEGDETVELTLTSPVGVPLGSPATTSLTIRDDDPPAVVSFAQSTHLVTENAGSIQVKLTRTGNLLAPATVRYFRASGTAAPGTDTSLTEGTITFAAGQTTASVVVPIISDSARETAETLVLALASPQADTTIGSLGTTRLTIAASDQQPDAWISTARALGYLGNDVYNATGSRQTRTVTARRTQTATFYIRVYNDGNTTNSVAIKGSAAQAGSAVSYFGGATNITREMRSASGWKVHLAPGKYRLVTVKIQALRRAAIGSLKTASVSGTWTGDGVRTDLSRAVVKVAR